MPTLRIPHGRMLVGGTYTAGSQPPDSSSPIDHEDWREVQHKAGLRQVICGQCFCGRYPQQVHSTTTATLHTRKGRLVQVTVVTCNDCAAKAAECITHGPGRDQ